MIHLSDNSAPQARRSRAVIATFTMLIALAVAPTIIAQTRKADDTELRKLMSMYAEAANKADADLGAKVWCGSEEDSVTNPGGHWQGAQQIKAFYVLLGDSYSE